LLAIAVVVGTVIGSGVFKKPHIVAENVPFFGLAAMVWIVGGLLAFLGASALAEVAIRFPRAGGNYVYLKEGYGPLAGFLFGWVEFCIIRSASIAALATIFSESVHDILRNQAFQSALAWDLGPEPLGYWEQQALTVAVVLGLAFVNVLGVRWGGLLQLFITIVKVGSLVAIALLPFAALAVARSRGQDFNLRTENLHPFLPTWQQLDLSNLGAALVGVLWAYHGWMNIATIGGEIRNPQRNIPLSFLIGVTIIISLYLAANLGYYLVIPTEEMARVTDTTVATVFSLRLLGPLGAAAASAAIMCSVFGALNGNLLVGPRLLYAMGEDGLAPRALGGVHARFRTPALAIIVLAVWTVILILIVAVLTRYRLPTLPLGSWSLNLNIPRGKLNFDVMTDFAIFGSVVFETLAVSTIFRFRRWPQMEGSYRCWGYPFVPSLYILIMSFVAINMCYKQTTEVLAAVGLVGTGVMVYCLSFRGRAAA
jgi:amino acid transporter